MKVILVIIMQQSGSSVLTTVQTSGSKQLEMSTTEASKALDKLVQMQIFVNKTFSYHFDRCLFNLDDLREKKEENIKESCTILMNQKQQRFSIYPSSQINQEKIIDLNKSGFEPIIDLELENDQKEKIRFNLKVPKRSQEKQEKRDYFKSTYICICEDSIESIPVSHEDILKFGREIYKVSIVNERLCPNFQWYKDAQEQDMNQEGSCRICLNSEQIEDDKIVNPCFCKGSCGLVHINCLRQWLEFRMIINKKKKVTAYNLNVFHCEICKTDLPKYIIFDSRVYELFPFFLESQTFLLLEKVSHGDTVCYITPFNLSQHIHLSIGRNEGNDIVLADNSISRKHAKLEISQGKLQMSDDKSKYGTLVEFRRNIYGLRRVILAKGRFIIILKTNSK